MIGHLGTRVSALLDGQLPAHEAEQAWAHVYACHHCRDLVEREGWIKTRLAGLEAERDTPSALKGSLLNLTPCESAAAAPDRRMSGMVLVGGGALGAALIGMVALGAVAGTGASERRPPVTQINTAVPAAPNGVAPTTGPRGADRLPALLDDYFN